MKYEYGVVDTVGFFFVTYFLLFLGFGFTIGMVRKILNNKVGIDEANEIADKELETCTWIHKLFQTYILKYVPEKKKSFLFYDFLVSVYLLCMITLPMHVVVYFITGYTMTGSISDIIINKYLIVASVLFLGTLIVNEIQSYSLKPEERERSRADSDWKEYEHSWKKWVHIKAENTVFDKKKKKIFIDAGAYLQLTIVHLLEQYDAKEILERLEDIYWKLTEFDKDAVQYQLYTCGFFSEKASNFTNDLWVFPDETYAQIQRIQKSYDCTDRKNRKKCLEKIGTELYLYAMDINDCVKKTDKVGYICELTQKNLIHAVDAYEDLLQRYLIAMDTEKQLTESVENSKQDIAYYRECIAERQKWLDSNQE